jgi:DNA-binding IclR family transcriptional regulator
LAQGQAEYWGVVSDDPEVAEFIDIYIPSIWALELLLFLRRKTGRAWTAGELVRELRASTNLVEGNLSRFERHGLALRDEEGWRFHPANLTLDALIAKVDQMYRERPMHVMGLVARTSGLRSLADAFRIKKDET